MNNIIHNVSFKPIINYNEIVYIQYMGSFVKVIALINLHTIGLDIHF